MATRDITRRAFSPASRYVDLHAQQGRLFTDSDQIEQAEIKAEDMRRSRLDIIGAAGSSDSGFRISNPGTNANGIDFEIGAGTFYLGGNRLTLTASESFQLQSDWLSNPGVQPPPPGVTRRDLAVLITVLQPVAATEDRETLEPGLGGPDTAQRLRPVSRVMLVEGVEGATCAEAWAEVVAGLAAAGEGTLNDENELITDTAFTIGQLPGSGGDDLCAPSVAGGYLGAENQAIRAMLTGNGQFIWGFNNAAPLYRVVIEDGGSTLRFLTQPRDALHWPTPGQTVELLPWGAVLPNGEKIAEDARPGHFAVVDSGYNPATRSLTLTPGTAPAAAFGQEWQARADAAALRTTRYGQEDLGTELYVYLRVWDRGTDPTPGPTLPLAPAPATLGTTGLTLSVQGADRRPGDFVILAARPATPEIVMPWALIVGTPPMGHRRFAAPLALLQWQGNQGQVLHDCRPPFRPLTELRGCCTYTVGDNNNSFGDFAVIQQAIDALPPTGGRICLLPGVFREQLLLDGLRNVRVTGCGPRSRLVPPDGSDRPLIDIVGGGGLQIDDFAIEAAEGPGIRANGVFEDERGRPVEGLRVENMRISARDASAIDARLVDDLVIRGNRIDILDLTELLDSGSEAGRAPAVFAQGERVDIIGNTIRCTTPRAVIRASGGLQIGGGSRDVLIDTNRIEGGNGNGITLGHVVMIPANQTGGILDRYRLVAQGQRGWVGSFIWIDANGCITFNPPGGGDDPGDGGRQPVAVSGGDLLHIDIRDNHVTAMGLSGIASMLAFDGRRQRPVVSTVRLLDVDRNEIRGCAQLETPILPLPFRLLAAFGGIALTSVEMARFVNNLIEGNGRSHLDAICGLSVIRGESLTISGNRILDNGPRIPGDDAPRPGLRAGIRVAMVQPQTNAQLTDSHRLSRMAADFGGLRGLSIPAITVSGNEVHQPLGKALQIMGIGPMMVHGNHLASQGTTVGSFESLLGELLDGVGHSKVDLTDLLFIALERLLGTTVLIFNLGLSRELLEGAVLLGLLRSTNLAGRAVAPTGIRGDMTARQPIGRASLGRLLQGGEVAFNDNIVIQNIFDNAPSLSLCSVFLTSLDDVGAHDNAISNYLDMDTDFCLANLIGLGWSIRVQGNRLEESLFRTLNSAITFGFFNDTSHNQATHCLRIIGMPALLTDAPNQILQAALVPGSCGGCMAPPFQGLTLRAIDTDGNSIQPQTETYNGVRGLWFGMMLTIDLPSTVDEIELGTISNDTQQINLEAFDAQGALVADHFLNPGGFEQTTRLSASGIVRVVITDKEARTLLTRVCLDRAEIGSSPGFAGATHLTTRGFS
ncbi:MAG: hypothetical protein ACK4GT_03410 [Pararhodobacter sp.]